MFQYVYPQFEKKHLLRVEMLEQLRDYPKEYLKMFYQDFGDGIISGCEISWDNGKLTISPGMLYRGQNLYFMETHNTLECTNEDEIRYLKAQFISEVKESGKITGNARILLDENKPNPSCEMELARFRLQQGARLRHSHENFEDYGTEYDTVNLIHAPYASKGGTTLHPAILRQYAIETMKNQVSNPYDVSFAMNVMANGGEVPLGFLKAYLGVKLDGSLKISCNQDIYCGLLKVLREQKQGERRQDQMEQGRRAVILV